MKWHIKVPKANSRWYVEYVQLVKTDVEFHCSRTLKRESLDAFSDRRERHPETATMMACLHCTHNTGEGGRGYAMAPSVYARLPGISGLPWSWFTDCHKASGSRQDMQCQISLKNPQGSCCNECQNLSGGSVWYKRRCFRCLQSGGILPIHAAQLRHGIMQPDEVGMWINEPDYRQQHKSS